MANGIRMGRFRKALSRDALDFLAAEDLEYDKHLVQEDILGSKAHVVMLWKQGIISKDEAAKLLKTLEAAGKLHSSGHFPLEKKLEDVHMNIEDFITRKVGAEVGGKIHTGRSRNDQVALDGRLYIRNAIIAIIDHLKELVDVVLRMATEHADSVMPGYTHLQHAQPITVGHWASAYGAMLLRDIDRLTATFEAVNICPLGAVASAGTSWPIDRTLTAQLLGFRGVQLNALDAVSSRGEDVAEYLSALSLLMMHLSRVAQDIVLWSSREFGMVEVDEAFATGSSIMPQKKNPDVAELIRAKAASVHSEFLTTVSILRALPTGYFKDSQETKHSMIRATETAKAALKVTAGMLSTLKLNVQRMQQLASANYSTATDLADFIAQKAGIPFRQAHRIVGLAV
ncbi:MAG: argininosuccinate lyase, partial [Candidatus Bathyarchaeia archaeon]